MVSLMTNPTFLCLCLAGASEGFLMTVCLVYCQLPLHLCYRASPLSCQS